jgi:hypothetical protein
VNLERSIVSEVDVVGIVSKVVEGAVEEGVRSVSVPAVGDVKKHFAWPGAV